MVDKVCNKSCCILIAHFITGSIKNWEMIEFLLFPILYVSKLFWKAQCILMQLHFIWRFRRIELHFIWRFRRGQQDEYELGRSCDKCESMCYLVMIIQDKNIHCFSVIHAINLLNPQVDY